LSDTYCIPRAAQKASGDYFDAIAGFLNLFKPLRALVEYFHAMLTAIVLNLLYIVADALIKGFRSNVSGMSSAKLLLQLKLYVILAPRGSQFT
jgi:hypothetical protein